MTGNGTLDERYLTFLVRQVEPVTNLNPLRTHWLLLAEMYKREFTWFVPNVDNRLLDGVALREQLIDEEEGGDVPGYWLAEPCSFLEMLIALSVRVAYVSAPLEPDYWFWRMIDNLQLRSYVDDAYDDNVRMDILDAMDRIVDRTYQADGNGGLFPLSNPIGDQRQIELWYQFQQYLMENIDV